MNDTSNFKGVVTQFVEGVLSFQRKDLKYLRNVDNTTAF